MGAWRTRAARALSSAWLAVALLAGCATLPSRPPEGVSSLDYDPEDVAEAERIVIALPGVLNSISIFDKALAWRADGLAIVRYRYPGMDGLELDHRVTVDGVIAQIRELLERYPDKPIALLGYSAGGQLALEAAAALAYRHPRLVVMSGATGFPQTVLTGLRAARYVIVIGVSEGTVDLEKIWKKFYPVLLFGAEGAGDPAMQARIEAIYGEERDSIVTPTLEMMQAQSGDLTWRRLDVDEALRDTPVLILHGQEDPVIPVETARRLAERLPRSRLVELEGQGHLIVLTSDEAFDLARDFLLADAAPGG